MSRVHTGLRSGASAVAIQNPACSKTGKSKHCGSRERSPGVLLTSELVRFALSFCLLRNRVPS